MSLDWRGDAVKRKVVAASKWGIDKTMSECVPQAKNNHPGWLWRFGAAETSVRIIKEAYESRGDLVGIWGSVGVKYVIYLEYKRGSFLRGAKDVIYPRLTGHINSKMKK